MNKSYQSDRHNIKHMKVESLYIFWYCRGFKSGMDGNGLGGEGASGGGNESEERGVCGSGGEGG